MWWVSSDRGNFRSSSPLTLTATWSFSTRTGRPPNRPSYATLGPSSSMPAPASSEHCSISMIRADSCPEHSSAKAGYSTSRTTSRM